MKLDSERMDTGGSVVRQLLNWIRKQCIPFVPEQRLFVISCQPAQEMVAYRSRWELYILISIPKKTLWHLAFLKLLPYVRLETNMWRFIADIQVLNMDWVLQVLLCAMLMVILR